MGSLDPRAAVGAAGFFTGFDRVYPRKWGRRGWLLALATVALAAALFVILAVLFNIAGIALFALLVLVVSWRPISRRARENRRRSDQMANEIRAEAVADSDFRLGEATYRDPG
jgi:membrane protein implicated in regulation of membrane protease activity